MARVVHRFGGDVTAVYPAGGATGTLLRRLVEQEGVGSVVIPAGEETREDFTVLEAESGSQFRFVMPGPRLQEPEWRGCLDAINSLGRHAEYVVASGSLPPGVPDGFYGVLAGITKKLGGRFVLDASGPALEAGLGEGVFLAKPNLRELSELVGAPLESEAASIEAARGLVAAGRAEIIALTLADKGALLVTRDGVMRAEGLPVEAVSTVGAGDSFLGAMVWAIASGHGLEHAFRYANAAGSAAVLAPGTELCRAEDVERLQSKVVLREAGVERRMA